MKTRTAIVGGGPAGIATAIQLARYGVRPVLFEGHELGGLLRNANLVENYPGFPSGIRGSKLVDLMVRQLHQHDIDLRQEKVGRISHLDGRFVVRSESGEVVAERLVLATGTVANTLPEGIVANDAADLLSHEVVNLREFRESRISIIGGGDAAFDYALQLAEHNDITIHTRADHFRALPLLIELVVDHPRIEIRQRCELTEARRQGEAELRCSWCWQGKAVSDTCHALLVAIGRRSNLEMCDANLLSNLDRLRETGDLHIIGDLANRHYRQVSIAVGDGVRAAMQLWESSNS